MTDPWNAGFDAYMASRGRSAPLKLNQDDTFRWLAGWDYAQQKAQRRLGDIFSQLGR